MTFILRYFLDMSGNLVNFYAFVILFKIYMYIYILIFDYSITAGIIELVLISLSLSICCNVDYFMDKIINIIL